MELEKDFYYKQKRESTSIINAFLEKRQKGIKGNNNHRYKYNYIKNQEEILLNKRNNNFFIEKEINKSYNSLRNNLNGKAQPIKINENKVINNNINIKNNQVNEDNNYFFLNRENEEIKKKYNEIKNKLIFTSDEKKENSEKNNRYKINNKNYETTHNGFGNKLKMEGINSDNYYTYEKNRLTSPQINKNKKYFELNNKDENKNNFLSENKVKNNNGNRNLNSNLCQIDKSLNSNDEMDYSEGEENHRFYDSSGVNDYLYNYESYKIKKYYKKNDKLKNLSQNFNKNRMNEISPIRNEIKSEYTDTDDIHNIEQEYDIQNNFNNKILKSYSCTNKNLKIFGGLEENKNLKKSENLEHNKILKESSNTKTVSISYRTKQNKINNEDRNNKGKEIIEIINDEKDIINDTNNRIIKDKNSIIKDKFCNKLKLYDENQNNNLIIKEPNNFFIIHNNDKERNIQKTNNNYFFKTNSSNKTYKNELTNDIKDKINLLKNNIGNNKENFNYNNEIDNYFIKIKQKQKQEEDILLPEKYFQKLSIKPENKTERKNDHKIKISHSSAYFNNRIKSIFNEHKLKSSNKNINKMSYLNSNSYLTETNRTEKFNKNKDKKKIEDKIPDINLICEENNGKLKLLEKKDYEKFNKKNRKIKRELISDRLNDLNNKTSNYKNKTRIKKIISNDYDEFNSARSLWFYFNNRIMPPNEI